MFKSFFIKSGANATTTTTTTAPKISLKDVIFDLFGKIIQSEECSKKILKDFNFFDIKCLRICISKALSFGIISGSAIVKVPQIFQIISSRSTYGLSIMSFMIESISSSITFSYNWRIGNNFSSYGETLFIVLQNVFILSLIFILRKRIGELLIILVLLSVFGWMMLQKEIFDNKLMIVMQMMTIPLTMFSKLPQIWSNFRHKNSGQLSLLTNFLVFMGCLARIFTNQQAAIPNDSLIKTVSIIGCMLNGVILGQIIWYGRLGRRNIHPTSLTKMIPTTKNLPPTTKVMKMDKVHLTNRKQRPHSRIHQT